MRQLAFCFFLVLLLANFACGGDWHSTGREPLPPTAKKAANIMSFAGIQPEMAEIVAASGECSLTRKEEEDKSLRDLVRPGDRVVSGDIIETGADGLVEIVLGINGRLVIGPRSSLQFAGMVTAKDGDAVATRRAIFLARGEIRVRVRRNTATPSPLLITLDKSRVEVGSNKLNVPGGVEVVLTPGKDDEGTLVSVLHGSAEISQVKVSSSGQARVIVPEGVAAPGIPAAADQTGAQGQTAAATLPSSANLPPGVKALTEVEKAKLRERLPFSSDKPETQSEDDSGQRN